MQVGSFGFLHPLKENVKKRNMIDWVGGVFLFFLEPFRILRCELCALSGEELEKDEELRRRLMDLEREAVSLHSEGFKVAGLQKMEQKMELMEEHWDEFSLEVGPHH